MRHDPLSFVLMSSVFTKKAALYFQFAPGILDISPPPLLPQQCTIDARNRRTHIDEHKVANKCWPGCFDKCSKHYRHHLLVGVRLARGGMLTHLVAEIPSSVAVNFRCCRR